MIKAIISGLLHMFLVLVRWRYKVRAKGLEHIQQLQQAGLIVSNHPSALDGLILLSVLPSNSVFALCKDTSTIWWLRLYLKSGRAILLDDPLNPLAIRRISEELAAGNHCVVFPEGRISTTGSLMKLYEGVAVVAMQSKAPVVGASIEGAQFSRFSRSQACYPRRHGVPITVGFVAPQVLDGSGVKGGAQARREYVTRRMCHLLMEAAVVAVVDQDHLYRSFLRSVRLFGSRWKIIEDIERNPLNYGRVRAGSLLLGERLQANGLDGSAPVGLLLPNASGAVVSFLAMQSIDVVPAMLNFSAGTPNLLKALEVAQIKHVVSSRRFLEKAELEHLVDELGDVQWIFLEDIRAQIGFQHKLRLLAGMVRPKLKAQLDDAAVILFTSGSEAAPKGVVLSHRNIQTNIAQMAASVDFSPKDCFFTLLPMFHSFGLTVSTLLPVMRGIRVFFYPSPLHYREIPEAIYETEATILFSTDTFLNGYARRAHEFDFRCLRLVFAGAEPLRPATARSWASKYGVRVLEGYGATEASPVIGANTPLLNRPGATCWVAPAIECKVEPVEGLTQGGRLWIKGENVMKGYLKVDQPGVIQPPPDGWYDTGDIVEFDSAGFMKLLGRAKRFAKIAGEMVSLAAVEQIISDIWPEHRHVVLAVADDRKGQRLVLVTDCAELDRAKVRKALSGQGTELMIPQDVEHIDEIPVLGSGKANYPEVERWYRQQHAVALGVA